MLVGATSGPLVSGACYGLGSGPPSSHRLADPHTWPSRAAVSPSAEQSIGPHTLGTFANKDFSKEFEEVAIRVAKEKKTSGTAAKRPKKGQVARMPIATDIEQSEAKLYIPEGGHIWRDRLGGAWCSHFPPFRRYSASFKKFGQAESLRLNIVDMWTKWCRVSGVSQASCPMKGVFDSSPLPPVAGGRRCGVVIHRSVGLAVVSHVGQCNLLSD